MRAEQLTQAGPEPITLAQAKLWLKVDTTADDALVEALVSAAREHVEAYAGLSLRPGTWRIAVAPRELRARPVELPRPPFSALLSAEASLADGTTQAVPLADLVVAGADPAILSPRRGARFPDGTVEIRVDYATAATAMPDRARQAMRLLMGHWYENRSAATDANDDLREPPHGVTVLLDGLKTFRI